MLFKRLCASLQAWKLCASPTAPSNRLPKAWLAQACGIRALPSGGSPRWRWGWWWGCGWWWGRDFELCLKSAEQWKMFLKNKLRSAIFFSSKEPCCSICVQLIVILLFHQTLGSLDFHYILLITNMPYFCGRFSVTSQYWFASYFCERWIRDLELKIFTTWFAKMTLVQGAEQWLVLDLNFFTNLI